MNEPKIGATYTETQKRGPHSAIHRITIKRFFKMKGESYAKCVREIIACPSNPGLVGKKSQKVVRVAALDSLDYIALVPAAV